MNPFDIITCELCMCHLPPQFLQQSTGTQRNCDAGVSGPFGRGFSTASTLSLQSAQGSIRHKGNARSRGTWWICTRVHTHARTAIELAGQSDNQTAWGLFLSLRRGVSGLVAHPWVARPHRERACYSRWQFATDDKPFEFTHLCQLVLALQDCDPHHLLPEKNKKNK